MEIGDLDLAALCKQRSRSCMNIVNPDAIQGPRYPSILVIFGGA